MKKRAILWYRNDLRVSDNEALIRALDENDEIIPLFILEARNLAEDTYGFIKTGPFRLKFLIESVIALKEELNKRSAGLITAIGDPLQIMSEISTYFNTSRIYASKEVTSEETQVERKLADKFDLSLYWGSTLYHPGDITFAREEIPDVFTRFRKSVEKGSFVRPLIDAPEKIPVPENFKGSGLDEIMELMPEIMHDRRSVIEFRGGSVEGQKRIKHYTWDTKSINQYKFTRNGLIGPDYSGKFSAWLANGSLSPREIFWEIKKFEKAFKSNISTYWMVFELIWRDYFRYVALKYGDRIFSYKGIRGMDPKLRKDREKLERWINSRTGEEFVDANMKEIKLTGYMSNRGRQNVASYLVKDMKVDWRMGAAWFESMLIDYDPCSNYGNWMYVAGVGNDPREVRYFNVKKQAERYDPDGEYVKLWLEGNT